MNSSFRWLNKKNALYSEEEVDNDKKTY